MNNRRAALGDLATRFFAYIQLKKKDTVKTGELSPVLGISREQERDLLRRLARSGWIVRLKRGLYLAPRTIPPGGKGSPGEYLALAKLMEDRQGTYQICGPSAFNFHGFDDQIPAVTYAYNNRISGARTIGRLTFQLIKVADERLGGTYAFQTEQAVEAVYSSKARTLMDAVYDWSRFNSLPRGYEWIRNAVPVEKELARELTRCTLAFGNQATIRRIGHLFETLNQPPALMRKLQAALSDSRSPIPWIPGRAARGKVDRKWEVIANG